MAEESRRLNVYRTRNHANARTEILSRVQDDSDGPLCDFTPAGLKQSTGNHVSLPERPQTISHSPSVLHLEAVGSAGYHKLVYVI